MFIVIGRDDLQEVIEEALEGVVPEIKQAPGLSQKIKEQRDELETLRIEKGRKEEEFEKREREIEHKVGLERTRQEFEMEQAKREATVAVREENLDADRKRFEEQMKFHEDRFTKEVTYLKEMLEAIVQRLPSAEFTADVTPARNRKR
jgi:hypothetical protein